MEPVISHKCNGSFLSLGILDARSDGSCSIQWSPCGAGKQKATLLWFYADDEEEPGNCRNIPVSPCVFCWGLIQTPSPLEAKLRDQGPLSYSV